MTPIGHGKQVRPYPNFGAALAFAVIVDVFLVLALIVTMILIQHFAATVWRAEESHPGDPGADRPALFFKTNRQ